MSLQKHTPAAQPDYDEAVDPDYNDTAQASYYEGAQPDYEADFADPDAQEARQERYAHKQK